MVPMQLHSRFIRPPGECEARGGAAAILEIMSRCELRIHWHNALPRAAYQTGRIYVNDAPIILTTLIWLF